VTDVEIDVALVEAEFEVAPVSVELTVAPVSVELGFTPPDLIELDVTTAVVDLTVATALVELAFNPPPIVNFTVSGGGVGGGDGVCYVPAGGAVDQVLSKRTSADHDTQWAQPGINSYLTPPDLIPTVPRVGDLRYDGENNNTPYRWDGTAWVDIHNLTIDLALVIAESNTETISENAGAISLINQQIEEIVVHTEYAERAADTADGRISMSDYEPTPADVTYQTVRFNQATGLNEIVDVPRVEGSLWYQRTRPRKNLVTNPSFEKNATGWQGTACTLVRWDPTEIPVLAGDYCLRVANTGNARVETTYAFTADESEWYAGSTFMQLVSGTGIGCFATITFYDVGNAILSTTTGEVENLIQTAPAPENWNRINVVAQAPAGTKSFRVGFHNPNPGDVWYLGACIVENLDELGKYFDGDSYDGFWEGGTGDPLHDSSQNPGPGQQGWQESTSRLYGDKIIGIWELHSATWVRKFFTDDTLGMIDARKITNLDELQLPPNSISVDQLDGPAVIASENLGAGDIVNIYNLNGQFRVRRANAAAGSNFQATGFVLNAVASGVAARVYQAGTDIRQIAMAPGPKWLAETPGAVTNIPPNTTGCTVQQVGTAADVFFLMFAPLTPVRII
jgi:hypothetical protein